MRKVFGFTLLELMITVGIVAILASLALAGYDFATRKTRRAAATGCLTQQAQAMERHYTTTMTYLGAAIPACSSDVTPYYTIRPAAGEPTATTYTLEAVPIGGQAKDTCGTLSLNHTARKTPATQGCW
ncbi:type IV pilin protein [Lysobacter sp. A6]|uniref:Type IV pilin protein n=1 Tax=Noviluteimonas lactosilytica TaxID=2888523 RepID=A0ABS8JE63_9GAMM|nr:type IV pilin protein [Lysobacter lactosilyticus]MCC8361854.1 type IV pilin protein [Lysobacter lactosilyticus]